ncbi:MAG: hypothetical protein ACFE9D_05925 [Promethearchaeota archaeon]
MIIELIVILLIIFAFLAVHFEEAVYAIGSLVCMLLLLALLFALNGAFFVAIFQLAVGVGTAALLFLSSEMLSEESVKKQTIQSLIAAIAIAILLSLPVIFLSVPIIAPSIPIVFTFSQALWDLRIVDILIQGLVILVTAVGVVFFFHEIKKEKGAS